MFRNILQTLPTMKSMLLGHVNLQLQTISRFDIDLKKPITYLLIAISGTKYILLVLEI